MLDFGEVIGTRIICLSIASSAGNGGDHPRDNIAKMKDGVMIVNTARGPIVNGKMPRRL
jgi:lactate dehydrogenase-like 2-hydroxyacid dehydrogenase